jgi:hypothetical protein
MINLIALIYATIFSGVVLYHIRTTYPSSQRLTTRGNRLVFLLLLVAGFLMAQIVLHINVNCDLTKPNSVCEIWWI